MADANLNNIKGIITNEGLSKSIEAQAREGWKIYPRAFAVSDILGLFDTTRDTSSMYETWYEGPIGGVVVQGTNTLEFLCTIPPGSTADNKNIREIYVTALDNNDNLFLLGLGQIEGDVQYNPGGSTKLRILITIQNVNISGLYEFKYTQASEIEDHNHDPNAHPDIRALLTGSTGATIINNNYYASPGDTVFVNSTTNPVQVNLPVTNLVLGTRVTVIDVGLSAAKAGHEIIVGRNGNKIDTKEENFQIDTAGGEANFYWYPSQNSWMVDIGGRFYRPAPENLAAGTLKLSAYLNPSQLFSTGSFTPEYGSGDVTASAGQIIFIDTSDGESIVKLPKNPISGERVQIVDSRGTAQTNNIRVTGQGQRVNGTTADYVINVNYAAVTFIWDAAVSNWIVDYGGNTMGLFEYLGNDVTPRKGAYTTTRNIVPNATKQGWLGTDTLLWAGLRAVDASFTDLKVTNTIQGTAFDAFFADLAEYYIWTGKGEPKIGTLVTPDDGHNNEAAIRATKSKDIVLGVISEKPGFTLGNIINEDFENAVPIALSGRVRVRVVGPIKKGQIVYAYKNGTACAESLATDNSIQYNRIGIALETNFSEGEKLVMCCVD